MLVFRSKLTDHGYTVHYSVASGFNLLNCRDNAIQIRLYALGECSIGLSQVTHRHDIAYVTKQKTWYLKLKVFMIYSSVLTQHKYVKCNTCYKAYHICNGAVNHEFLIFKYYNKADYRKYVGECNR